MTLVVPQQSSNIWGFSPCKISEVKILESAQQVVPDLVVIRSSDAKTSNPEPGLTRRIGAYNEKLFIAEHHMEKGWVGAAHSHPHDQIVYIVSGHLKVSCAGQQFDVSAGDSFVVRGGVEHQASALEASHVIDVFTPCRYDYL